MSARDPMRGWVDAFPAMLEEAWAAPTPDGFPIAGPVRFIVPAGMGGSGMAGSLAALRLAEQGLPVAPWRDALLPSWVRPGDALVLVSYSGETWETLSLLDQAIARGIPVRAIASGGRLAGRCASAGIPCFPVPAGMAPRASLPWLLAGIFRATGGFGDSDLREAAAALRADRNNPAPGRDPVAIAGEIERKLVCLIPAGFEMETVAVRWRNQLLENGKRASFVSPLPEMAHNEIMGWDGLRDLGVPIAFVALPGAAPHEKSLAAIRALGEIARKSGYPFLVVPPPASGGFAGRLADVQLGDRVSVELSDRLGVEATPVEAIARLRALTGGKESIQ